MARRAPRAVRRAAGTCMGPGRRARRFARAAGGTRKSFSRVVFFGPLPIWSKGMVTAPRVLVIDDDPDLRRATVEILRFAGFDVAEAETGEDGIACAAELPDLILCDVQLP